MKFAVLALLVASAQAADPVCVSAVTTYATNNCSGNGTVWPAANVTALNTAQVAAHKANCTAVESQSVEYTCSATGGAAKVFAGANCSGNATNATGAGALITWTSGACTQVDTNSWAIVKSGITAPKKTNNTTGGNKTGNNTSNSTNNSSGAQALAATFAASAALLATVY